MDKDKDLSENEASESEDQNQEKIQQTEEEKEEQNISQGSQQCASDVCTKDTVINANAILEEIRKLKDEIKQERMKRIYPDTILDVCENTLENDKTDQEKLRRMSQKDAENKGETQEESPSSFPSPDGEEEDQKKEEKDEEINWVTSSEMNLVKKEKKEMLSAKEELRPWVVESKEHNNVREKNNFEENIKEIWIQKNINEKIREQLEQFNGDKDQERDTDELESCGTEKLGNLDEIAQDYLDIVQNNGIQDNLDNDIVPNNNKKPDEETIEGSAIKNTNSLETLISEINEVFKREIDSLLNQTTS
ncbi:hypothetical protein WDU94_013005 [Cyamophila willieti]